ncbi:hypothetical protein ACSBM8_00720 [Sphingomonas sp. ASY06-1R]|uniref:hypothetical protein n=1 Tax=Sphingomonas sp. ASY06-1R TaxID=3445771 RepID=UPI003FA1F133
MTFEMKRLVEADGTWADFRGDWAAQCDVVGENPEEYAAEPLKVIGEAAASTGNEHWAVGLSDGSHFLAVALLHWVMIPGFTGKVLRVRQIVVSPKLDYGLLPEDAYAETLIELTFGIINLSDTDLPANHIKFHMRSPGDMAYFRAFGRSLDKHGVFKAVETHGAWLTVTKY